jgi:hypothetical protein
MLKTRPRTRNVIPSRQAKASEARRQVAAAQPQSHVCIGVLVDWDDKGPLVTFEGNTRGPLRARLSGGTARTRTLRPGETQEVVLLIDSRTGRPPVLLGMLQALGATDGPSMVEARVDGRRVELEGRDEIVLRCGEATITLRRNGRIVIRGVQVETRASGVNRIRGGSVAIN